MEQVNNGSPGLSGEELVDKRCYTVEDLQKILCASRSSIYNLIKRNEFRAIQIGGGGKYRIPKKSFDAWLDAKA